MNFTPRRPQALAASAWDNHDHRKGGLVVLPTGVGKTGFALWLALTRHYSKGERVLWLAHRKELVEQPLEALEKWWPEAAADAGIVKASRDEHDRDIVFASKDTLRQPLRLQRYLEHGVPGIVVVDEAHHSVSPSWIDLLSHFGSARKLGLTATPDREDSKSLGEHWELLYSYSLVEAIEDEYLTRPVWVDRQLPDMDLSAVGGRKDYIAPELGRELLRQHIVEHTVAAFQEEVLHGIELPWRQERVSGPGLQGRQGLVFTATVEQAQVTAEALRKAGMRARWVAGSQAQPEGTRSRIIKRFRQGRIDIICNAAALTEGTDLPMADYVVLARPTRSWTLLVQIVGRGLRLHKGQQYGWVVDLVGAMREQSLVSAAVLIGQTGCPENEGGEHVYLATADGGGVCRNCDKEVACIKRKGSHLYKDGVCKACGAEQCPDSPFLMHHWVPWEDHQMACAFCDALIADPLRGLVNRKVRGEREDAAWKLLNTPGVVYAVHMGDLGVLYNVQAEEGWQPFWLNGDSLEPQPLAPKPVSGRYASMLCDDVLRRCDRIKGKRGGRPSEWQYRRAYRDAENKARRLQIWKRTTP